MHENYPNKHTHGPFCLNGEICSVYTHTVYQQNKGINGPKVMHSDDLSVCDST